MPLSIGKHDDVVSFFMLFVGTRIGGIEGTALFVFSLLVQFFELPGEFDGVSVAIGCEELYADGGISHTTGSVEAGGELECDVVGTNGTLRNVGAFHKSGDAGAFSAT